jgi:anti-anti-sigma factor
MNADIVFVIRAASLQGRALSSLRRELRAMAVPGRRLILDLSGVEKVNAVCAGLILEISSWLQNRGGSLKLVGLRQAVAAYFELLRLHRSVEMHNSQADALGHAIAA